MRKSGAVLALLLTVAFALSGCGTALLAMKGQVLDRTSGKPIADAFVIRFVEGDALRRLIPDAGGQGRCAIAGHTRSDAAGKYRFPAFSTSAMTLNVQKYTLAYKPGYRHKDMLEQLEQENPNVNFLWSEAEAQRYQRVSTYVGAPQTPVVMTRVRYLLNMASGLPCSSDEVLYPLHRAIYLEALESVATQQDEQDLKQLCVDALTALTGDLLLDSKSPCDKSMLPEAQ